MVSFLSFPIHLERCKIHALKGSSEGFEDEHIKEHV